MMKITSTLFIDEAELTMTFIRSAGPGGQNVNKVETAVLLRFNILRSPSLPEDVRGRLITMLGSKLTQHGDILIKANRYRTQERNKQDAYQRLIEFIKRAVIPPKKRKKTKPTFASKQKRLDSKKKHAKIKKMRQVSYKE